jgi:hypothetical protein
LLKVVNYFVGAKIFVFQDAGGVVVSKKDARSVIDDGNVVLVDDQVVNSIAVANLWLANVLRIDPFTLNFNRMLVSDFQTSDLAESGLRIFTFESQEALNFS